MLSPEDSQRIREDEGIRERVRDGEPARTPVRKFLAFLNTGVGLWFLSTVLVGFTSWGLTCYHERHTQTQLAGRLDMEIGRRLFDARHNFRRVLKNSYANSTYDSAASDLTNSRARVFHEFADASLSALFWQRRAIATTHAERERFQAGLDVVSTMEDLQTPMATKSDNAIRHRADSIVALLGTLENLGIGPKQSK
jgi:hypothetical protein